MIPVSNSPHKPAIPNKIIDLLVDDIFRKNGINVEDGKGKLSIEQRQLIKDLVDDLRKQVDAFVKNETPSQNSND